MRVLFITSPEADYLSDGLLIGFRSAQGIDVVDFPAREVLYKDCENEVRRQVRGNGFTLYTGLLDPIQVDRYGINTKLENGHFDLIVFSDIWRQFGLFSQWRPYLNRRNTIICDGADSSAVYPYAGCWWRKPYYWLLPRAHREFLYFKRELTSASQFNLWHRFLPRGLWSLLPAAKNLRKIAFSIPQEKIVRALPTKHKQFPRHIVDPELAAFTSDSGTGYAFLTEQEYYRDLQVSKYGITTKRAGWDCLRHYEIAANAAIICFRNLQRKPSHCAPHGLIPGYNCISYSSARNLREQIASVGNAEYRNMQLRTLEWARSNTCVLRVEAMLHEWRRSLN
jgi:hypothetical protein